MESLVKFHPSQEVPSSEMNFLQVAAQSGIDTTILQLLIRSVFYKGLIVTKNSATEIKVTAGRIWANGKAYRLDADTTINMTSYLPAGSNKKIVAIVATGQEVDTAAAPRKFLVDPNTRTSRSRTVATRVERTIVLSVVEGVESFAPVPPVVDVNLAHLSTITLSSTGIVGDPVQDTDQVAPNLEDAVAAIQVIRGELDRQLGMISTLRTDLAGLARQVTGLAPQSDIERIEQQLLMLREKTDIPDLASFWGLDLFDTESESDTAHGAYSASVGGGALALPLPDSVSAAPALLNPLDSRVMTAANGITLPAYTETMRYELAAKDVEINLAAYPVVTKTRVKKLHGWSFKKWKNRHRALWRSLKRNDGEIRVVDPETGNMTDIEITSQPWRSYPEERWGKWMWLDQSKAYWLTRTTSTNVTGSVVAQTFLNAQAGWLTGVSLWFSAVGASGDVRVILCECRDDGTPDFGEAIEEVVIPHASLAVGWVKASLPPAHLARGVRYAIAVVTGGAHKLWASNKNGLSNGTLFYSTDASYFDGSLQQDISIRLHYASFPTNLVTVEIDPASLVGGIDSLDFTFTGVRPDAVDFDVQAQVSGVWRNLDDENDTVLASRPNLVPLRMVWQNTTDDAVGVVLTKSRVIAYRPSLTGIHISTARTLPSGTTDTVVVRQRLRGYLGGGGGHTHAIKLLHGGGFGSTKTAAATATRTLENGDVEFEATFDFTGAEISTWKIRTEMTITDTAVDYVVVERWDHAL